MIKEPKTKTEALLELVTIEDNLLSSTSWRVIIDLNDEPVTTNLLEGECYPKSVRSTCGQYAIKYLPKSDRARREKFPFVFINDMLPMRICVSGPAHLRALAGEIPEIGWILRNSNYESGLFHYAWIHPGLKIPFSINAAKYADKVCEKAKEMGIDTTGNAFRPFVNFIAAKPVLEKMYGKKKEWKTSPLAYSKILAKAKDTFKDEFKE